MEYIFQDRFNISSKGEQVEAESIIIKAPSSKIFKYVSRLDKELSKSLMNATKENFSEEEKEKDSSVDETNGDQFIFMLMATGLDLEKCIDNFKWVLKLSAFVNENKTVTDSMIDKISYNDMKSLLGEYIKSFLFISQVG